ncbi:MAG: hypothetical protein N3A69_08740 [Leptospiraceae bacterium]|nr:hypothetical protein [Leptospiraceae bacterium]
MNLSPISELLKIYEESLKNGRNVPVKVSTPVPPRVGQIRELLTIPVERFVILSKIQDGLYLTAPMTAYLQLLPKDSLFYKLSVTGVKLGVIPTWDYLREEIILNYTLPIGSVPQVDIPKIEQWVRSWRDDSAGYAVRKFISLNSKVWAKWTMWSLFHQADIEEENENLEETEEE